jgi:hypothetical protein
VQYFKNNLIKNYKLAQEAQDEETKDDPDAVIESMVDENDELLDQQPDDEEDPNAKN